MSPWLLAYGIRGSSLNRRMHLSLAQGGVSRGFPPPAGSIEPPARASVQISHPDRPRRGQSHIHGPQCLGPSVRSPVHAVTDGLRQAAEILDARSSRDEDRRPWSWSGCWRPGRRGSWARRSGRTSSRCWRTDGRARSWPSWWIARSTSWSRPGWWPACPARARRPRRGSP